MISPRALGRIELQPPPVARSTSASRFGKFGSSAATTCAQRRTRETTRGAGAASRCAGRASGA
eukprot:scaffold16534_cov55-Phaeocystis_antarctica.AAC.4